MADPYLEDLERVFRAGVRDLHEAASKLFPETDPDEAFSTVCNTFNNGLLKGYWRIVTAEEDDGDGYMVAFGVTDGEDDNYNVSQAKVRVGIAREALGTALEGLVT